MTYTRASFIWSDSRFGVAVEFVMGGANNLVPKFLLYGISTEAGNCAVDKWGTIRGTNAEDGTG